MKNKNKWSKGAQEKTKEVLDDIQVQYMRLDTGVHLKYRTKNGNRKYGYIKIEDVLSRQYTINVLNSDGKISDVMYYDSIDDLIFNGWVID